MADYYVDHGVYTSALGTTPTWGVPQEGDGSATTAAAASSVASIAFGSVPASGAMSVCGITIGTAGVIGAATVDAAANALAGLINAVTTTVASGVAVGTPQLRNLVFARGPSGGAPAGTCEIMMRVGSTTLNQATNSNAAIASTFNGTPTLVQFVGGTGGCWGWMINSSAIGVASSYAVASYGLMKAAPIAWTVTPDLADLIYVRSGTNPVIACTASTNFGRFFSSAGANQHSTHFVIDTNTKWTSDSAVGTFKITVAAAQGSSLPMLQSISSNQNLASHLYAISALRAGGFTMEFASTTSAGYVYFGALTNDATGGGAAYLNCHFLDTSAGTSAAQFATTSLGTGGGASACGLIRSVACLYQRIGPIATKPVLRIAVQGNNSVLVEFEACELVSNISGATADPIIVMGSTAPLFVTNYKFSHCKFSGWAAGGDQFDLHDSTSAVPTQLRVEAIDCDGLALTAAYAGIASLGYSVAIDRPAIIQHSSKAGGPFRYENAVGVVEYNPAASPAQPTYAAVQPGGAAWSIHARWLATALVVDRVKGFVLPVIRMPYLGASATKTITLQGFIHSTLEAALKFGDIEVVFSYISNVDDTLVSELVAIHASSAVSWTGAAGYASHVAVKWEHTTAVAIKQYGEIAARVTLKGSPRSAVSESVFIDPEFSLT